MSGERATTTCPACKQRVGYTLLNAAYRVRRLDRHGSLVTGECSGSGKFLSRKLRHDR